MNVAMAFQVFSLEVAVVMDLYKEKDERLKDSGSTIAFIKRVNEVIVAMTSRCPIGALKPDSESSKAISDFQEYLEEWHNKALENDWKFLSPGTYQGFKLTLKSTIEVMMYLTENCGFEYLMTSRLNQDALEGMFGMYRDASGSSDHPDPLLFIQIYRLMSFYSLVKPPKGSNVEGIEMFQTLLDSKDVDLKAKTNQLEWKNTLEKIIERGENHPREYDLRDAHDYNVWSANEYAQAYFSGFIANKIKDWTSCSECLSSASKSEGNCERDRRIKLLTNGYLKFPSDALFNLLIAIERAILKTIGAEELNCYSFQRIAENILLESFPFIGCQEHKGALTNG
ncbi:uncharacterized protein [Temnothorax nylanderi]|uniref:uncharacterized protein isoform X2 n=1 Tax=Temnothorax nylanderi TaxID=102681 RepID=UPI003A87CBBD